MPCAETPEAVKGADVLTVVRLSFLEAALGKRHSLQVAHSQYYAPNQTSGNYSRMDFRNLVLTQGKGKQSLHGKRSQLLD